MSRLEAARYFAEGCVKEAVHKRHGYSSSVAQGADGCEDFGAREIVGNPDGRSPLPKVRQVSSHIYRICCPTPLAAYQLMHECWDWAVRLDQLQEGFYPEFESSGDTQGTDEDTGACSEELSP